MTSRHKRYKAFVSSTFIDLKDHRAHVIRSLRRAGFDVDPMEDWTADSDEPKKFSQDRLADCDVCVLLVAFRRGFVAEGETLSITQMEHEAALKQGVEVLVYQLDDNAKWWAKYDEREKDQALGLWRSSLGKKHGVEFFTDDPQSIDVTSALTRWMAKNKSVQSEAVQGERIEWSDGKSPYRGLQWFTPEYASLFFGRDREVAELIAKMSEPGGRTVLVIGDSGSGKSSLVGAGVWQAVITQGRLPGSTQWKWQRIQPSDGDTPWDALARGLKETFQLSARPRLTGTGSALRDVLSQHLTQGQELILSIDQFEELFTSGFHEPDIQTFLEHLIGTAQDATNRLRVIATIRSEFLGRLHAYPSTLNVLNRSYQYHVGPMSPRMLQEMIEKPAEATGYQFEPRLVERILQDTGQEPGNVALVEYALTQLFERRKGRMFTTEAYTTIGGVVGAIATKANEVLSELPEKVRGSFDTVFAELVQVQRDRPPTRNRAAFSLFETNQAAVQLIEALAGQDCRVLVTSRGEQEAMVEVAHEKLFSAWPELKDWIDNSDRDLRLIDFEEECAARWHEKECRVQSLWSHEQAVAVHRALARIKKASTPRLQAFLHPQQILIERLNDEALSHQDRFLIGQKLEEFGDTRDGVGVKNGLPDIVWIEIPGGHVKLEGIDYVFQVKPFRIAKYPVTNAQFRSFLSMEDGYGDAKWWTGICQSEGPVEPSWREVNCPRETVSWYEAVAFCRWLSTKLQTSIRLPTEWEWQQAATGGDPAREYPWEGRWDASRCNSMESRLRRSAAVGLYPASATQQGVMDMVGNVWEWCLNAYSEPEQPKAVRVNKKYGARVVRGGSWANVDPVGWNLLSRLSLASGGRFYILGFRLVQDIP